MRARVSKCAPPLKSRNETNEQMKRERVPRERVKISLELKAKFICAGKERGKNRFNLIRETEDARAASRSSELHYASRPVAESQVREPLRSFRDEVRRLLSGSVIKI